MPEDAPSSAGDDPGSASARLTFVGALEGHYVTLIVDGLHREGVLDALAAGADVAAIAAERGFEARVLSELLEYVALRCDLVDRLGAGRFALAPAGRTMVAHLLDQYVGGFGPCLRELGAVLRDARGGAALVDARRHAAAFARGDGAANAPEIVQLADELELGVLLDVGCGGGQLLSEIAARRPNFRGIGIDANPSVAAAARAAIARRGFAERIEIRCGDALGVARELSERQRAAVDAIAAVSVANAYSAGYPGRTIDDFLRALQALFPNRIVFVCDYYGRLGAVPDAPERFGRTLLHDVAQVVSGQGVPPADAEAWRAIYARTDCTLIAVYEDENDGIRRFLHIVQL